MDFPFPINRVFRKKITKVNSSLIPDGFKELGAMKRECSYNVAMALDTLGYASAKAQDLIHPVTTADRLRTSEHTVYLMTDPDGNSKKGLVVGFLKMGYKNLFLFDKAGRNHEMKPLCVLDFYIHEPLQRSGLGKILYDHMLQDEEILPQHLAVDKPSDKFMNFMKKHYSLRRVIPQANNYMIFEDFFGDRPDGRAQYQSKVHITNSVAGGRKDEGNSRSTAESVLSLDSVTPSTVSTPETPLSVAPPPSTCQGYERSSQHYPVGRYSAWKPPATVGSLLGHHPPITRWAPEHPCADTWETTGSFYSPLSLHATPVTKASDCRSDGRMAHLRAVDQYNLLRQSKFRHTPLW